MRKTVMQGSGQQTSGRDQNYPSGLQQFFAGIYQNVALGLFLCGGISFLVSGMPSVMEMLFFTPLRFVVLLAPLGLSMYLSFNIMNISADRAQAIYWIYCALIGVMISGVFVMYTGASIANAFFVSAGIFGGAAVYGYTTNADLSKISNILFVGLIGLVITSLVNMFMKSEGLDLFVSAIAVILFTALIAYENQALKNLYYMRASEEDKNKLAILGALNLFIAFINLFLNLLRLMNSRRD